MQFKAILFSIGVCLSGISIAQTSSEGLRLHYDPHSIEVPNSKGTHMNSPMACTAAANDNYSMATNIAVGGTLTAQSTCGTVQAGELFACGSGQDQSVWYTFTATSTTTFIKITNSGSCYVTGAVYSGNTLPTSYCSMITCQDAASGPSPFTMQLNTTVGVTYHIQVSYNSGGPCGFSGSFDITVSNSNPGGTLTNPAPSTSVSSPNAGCYLNTPSTNPSCTTVSSSCTSYTMTAGANNVYDAYYSFTTGASQSNDAQFQDCISQTGCATGNVDWMAWQLYDQSGNCLASGNLNTGLSISNAGCNSSYVLHYIFETVNCNYTSQAPFIDNYSSTTCGTLPIQLASFTAKEVAGREVELQWTTLTEQNNSHFTVERSTDGINFTGVGIVKAAGNSLNTVQYTFTDTEVPSNAVIYYRLRQTDYNGSSEAFRMVEVVMNYNYTLSMYPNPSSEDFTLEWIADVGTPVQYEVADAAGRVLMSEIKLSSGGLQHETIKPIASGVYFLSVKINGQVERRKMVKL